MEQELGILIVFFYYETEWYGIVRREHGIINATKFENEHDLNYYLEHHSYLHIKPYKEVFCNNLMEIE